MSIIHVTQHLDSDTLHLPQLRPLIGKQVEITIREVPVTRSSPDPWQALGDLSGQDLVDPQVVEEYREFDRQHWQPGK